MIFHPLQEIVRDIRNFPLPDEVAHLFNNPTMSLVILAKCVHAMENKTEVELSDAENQTIKEKSHSKDEKSHSKDEIDFLLPIMNTALTIAQYRRIKIHSP